MAILFHSIKVEDQYLSIYVAYSIKEEKVESIRSVFIQEVGREIDITGVAMKLFEADLNKIIDETDWRELYRSKKENCSI